MGMFGAIPRQRRPMGTPGYGDGVPSPVPFDMQPMQTQVPQIKKPGFFAEGQPGRQIIGNIGDALIQWGGGQPMYAPTVQNKLKQRMEELRAEREEQQYQRRRMDSREDWMWQRENTPQKPQRFRNNAGDMVEIGPDGSHKVVYDDPTDKLNWIQVDTPQGKMIVPVGPNGPIMNGMGQQGSSDDEWEYEDGGPSPDGSGGFR